jgi:hypothetical protein
MPPEGEFWADLNRDLRDPSTRAYWDRVGAEIRKRDALMNQVAPWYPPVGSYVVVSTPGWRSRVIRLATRSWADHALIVVNDAGGIVEAEPGGVRLGHLTEYSGRRAQTCTQGSAAQRQVVAKSALGMVGLRYDDLDIVDIGLGCIGIKWGWLERLVEQQKSIVCSQLVAKCGQIAGLDWSCGQKDLALVTPGMLAARLPLIK